MIFYPLDSVVKILGFFFLIPWTVSIECLAFYYYAEIKWFFLYLLLEGD